MRKAGTRSIEHDSFIKSFLGFVTLVTKFGVKMKCAIRLATCVRVR